VKKSLHSHCLKTAKSKVRLLQDELVNSQEGAASEDKSTAGDKHETGRAMMHLEQEKLHKQLADAENMVAELHRINPSIKQHTVQLGSLVYTDRTVFYLAAGLGKIPFENKDYFVVSVQAPIAKLMMGKQLGERFSLNDTEYVITGIE
jgi:transcription elongation GreA/GreB family factor